MERFMTPNPQNADKFDINQIERELKAICLISFKVYDVEDPDFYWEKLSPNDFRFLIRSPQRLVAAVERIRELEQEIERLKKYNEWLLKESPESLHISGNANEWLLKESPESLHISGNAMDIRLKSSDEE